MLKTLKTCCSPEAVEPLVLAAERLQGEVLGEFRKTAELLPHRRLVLFPGVTGFVQHLLPVPCARIWLDFAASLSQERQ